LRPKECISHMAVKDAEMENLLDLMLAFDPSLRPSAEELLKHNVFQDQKLDKLYNLENNELLKNLIN